MKTNTNKDFFFHVCMYPSPLKTSTSGGANEKQEFGTLSPKVNNYVRQSQLLLAAKQTTL